VAAALGLTAGGFWKTILFQKPLAGFLSRLSVHSGSALIGVDGAALMILNIQEVVRWPSNSRVKMP
jgi:hypothetical protein